MGVTVRARIKVKTFTEKMMSVLKKLGHLHSFFLSKKLEL